MTIHYQLAHIIENITVDELTGRPAPKPVNLTRITVQESDKGDIMQFDIDQTKYDTLHVSFGGMGAASQVFTTEQFKEFFVASLNLLGVDEQQPIMKYKRNVTNIEANGNRAMVTNVDALRIAMNELGLKQDQPVTAQALQYKN